MNPLRIGGRDRRAIRVGALALAPALAFAFVVKPYVRAYKEARGQLAAQHELLGRELALLTESARYPDHLRRSKRMLLREAPRLFDGADPLAGSAALANYVGARAIRSRVFIQRSETGAGEATGDGVLALRVDIRAQGDLEGMLGFLRSLEDGPKLVRVGHLELERSEGAISRGGDGMEALTLAATVEGYALAETPDSTMQPVVVAAGERQQ